MKRITATLMDYDQDMLDDEATLENLAIDSLDRVDIITAVEDELGVDLEAVEIFKPVTFGDLVEAIQREIP